ncbi:uncharacterized protein LOC123560004 [Mercenaria mercenaria]|uniref:uncharacterized protein LOC123560004 n=1 Tax=Mercenaria mercenaria TaxID=6596 RepID=UPI00234ED372|nr:uncharacterized protein LOC123560004 [Mercenaria mercenaria]
MFQKQIVIFNLIVWNRLPPLVSLATARNKMAADPENEKFYLEREQLTVDSDDEFQYEEVPVDEDFVAPDLPLLNLEEDLDLAVRTIKEYKEDEQATVSLTVRL